MNDVTLEEANQEEVAIPVLPTVGEQLRQAREAKGLALAEVGKVLKLGVRQLEALECGYWHALPGATFIRGFVRNYARLVDLDGSVLMEQLDGQLDLKRPELKVPKNMQAEMPEPTGVAQRRDYAFVSFGLVLVAVALAVYFFMPDDLSRLKASVQSMVSMFSRPAPEAVSSVASDDDPVLPPGSSVTQVLHPQPAQTADALPAEARVEPPAAAADEPAAASLPVTGLLKLSFAKESWVEVRDRRGNVIFSQHGQPGTEKGVDGQPPFALVIGYAPGVNLAFRGRKVDLAPYTQGDVARLTLE